MSWLDDIIDSVSDFGSDLGDSVSSWFDSGSDSASNWSPAMAYSDIPSLAANDWSPIYNTLSDSMSNWSPAMAYSNIFSSPDTSMFDQGGFEGLGIGNPSSYSGLTNRVSSPDSSNWLSSLNNGLQSAGTFFESPGGKLAIGLGGAGISALGAIKQNKLLKEAAEKQAAALAARMAEANKYSAPVHLANQRTRNDSPMARNGETAFFSNNRLPSYFADGGGVGVLSNLRKYAKGRDIDNILREAEGDSQISSEQKMIRGRTPDIEGGSRSSEADSYAAEASRMEAEALAEALKRISPIKKKNFLGFCDGGALGYVKGGSPGQADTIDAKVSDGEYVMDADIVSSLGDGNNAAGAKQLDKMRENIRAHKRSAPSSKIPPKAKSPLEYMKSKKVK